MNLRYGLGKAQDFELEKAYQEYYDARIELTQYETYLKETKN